VSLHKKLTTFNIDKKPIKTSLPFSEADQRQRQRQLMTTAYYDSLCNNDVAKLSHFHNTYLMPFSLFSSL
jgi:hypothetical protein